MNPALKTLLYLSLCGTALACVLAIVQRLVGRRLPSRFYYFAWLVVLARFALPIPGLVPTQPGAAGPQKITAQAPQRMVALPSERDSRSDAPVMDEPDFAEGEPVTVEAAAATEPTAPPETASVQTAAKPRESFAMPNWGWTAIWVLGAAGCALWYVLGYRRFTHALRKTLLLPRAEDERIYRAIEVRRRPALARSRAVATPMLFGLFHPVIVLPDEDYDSETLRLILLHELTHHRRGDIAVKWMAALVYSLHWFNPFLLLIRRRVDECCELSCDERLLRGMDKSQRQAYGHALLAMAGSAPLSAAVVSTTFATEKRTLKERLEQIMKYKTRKGLVLLWALAAAMLLCACTVAIGPGGEGAAKTFEIELSDVSAQASGEPGASSEEPIYGVPDMKPPQETIEVTKPVGGQIVTVSTVDELLAAIAPGNEVHLEPGVYDLDQASDYGQERLGGYYTWEEVHDGYALVIDGVSGLIITCEGDDDTAEIRTLPRYADVLAFYDCEDIALSDLVIGHTEGAGLCKGSVVSFTSGSDMDIARCGLYGCGTIGLKVSNSWAVTVENSDIYECSQSAAELTSCYDVAMVDCRLYDCGEPEWMGSSLVELMGCYEVEVINCDVYNNSAAQMVAANYSKRVMVLGCAVWGNEFSRGLFGLTRAELIVDLNSFEDVGDGGLIAATGAYGNVSGTATGTIRNVEGKDLTSDDLRSMRRGEYVYNGEFVPPETVALDIETGEDGRHYVTVSNVDELLAAIAPNTTIRIEAGEYDLSEAEYYGVPISEYYGWSEGYDGPQLVISGVDGLTIEGAGADVTELLAVPRSAEIIHFFRCEDLTVSGLTAGHVEMDTGCGAGVLGFEDCARVEVSGCGLFGCGTEGVTARWCRDLTVGGTEIYECSAKAASIYECENVAFENCDIHDCTSNEIFVDDSVNVTCDGKTLA